MTRALLEQAMDTLGNVAGNINPERGYADALEAEVKATFQAIRAELAKPEQQERKSMGVPPMQAMPIEGSPNEYLAKPEQPAPAWHDAVREQRDFLLASQALLIESANSGQEAQQAEIERLRNLIAAHVNSSNNDDSAGDTFGALMAEVIKETP